MLKKENIISLVITGIISFLYSWLPFIDFHFMSFAIQHWFARNVILEFIFSVIFGINYFFYNVLYWYFTSLSEVCIYLSVEGLILWFIFFKLSLFIQKKRRVRIPQKK